MTLEEQMSGDPRSRTVLRLYADYTSEISRKVFHLDFDLSTKLDGRAAFVFHHNPQSEPGERAARFALAAGLQHRFWEAHERLYKLNPEMPFQDLQALSEELGLDWSRIADDMGSEAVSEALRRDKEAASRDGAGSTPLLFINDTRYDGAWDSLSILEEIERPVGVRLRIASERFHRWAASAGLVLILATLSALLFVNLGGQGTYDALRHTELGLSFGASTFALTLELWINDGLMAIFFLIVGIEIKREILYGELSSLSKAVLPLIGAFGGICVPIAIYLVFNLGLPTQKGWGIPMATDIAFTLGLMALLGSRIPLPLKVFVSALAIADDLGAILVIAIFYGHGFHLEPFLWGLGVLGLMLACNWSRIYARTPYMLLAVLLWFCIFESGLHATLAGVLTAALIPSRNPAYVRGIAAQTTAIFETTGQLGSDAVSRLQNAVERLREPGHHIQHNLEGWSNYLILPLFAFFNTGIVLSGSSYSPLVPVSVGVMLGLMLGKPLGIFLFCWLSVRAGIASLSPGVTWRHMIGAGCLAGVGFTMSIFISTSAFDGDLLNSVKLSVLIGSVVAAVLGMLILSSSSGEMNDTR